MIERARSEGGTIKSGGWRKAKSALQRWALLSASVKVGFTFANISAGVIEKQRERKKFFQSYGYNYDFVLVLPNKFEAQQKKRASMSEKELKKHLQREENKKANVLGKAYAGENEEKRRSSQFGGIFCRSKQA
jgi:hypothetical protein